jgi:ribosomal protein S18 acetylase RimI-like enzyme
VHRIEALAKVHDRDGFDCGSEALNLFLKQTARQHATRGVSRTFVLVDEAASEPKPILGFFALNLCQIQSDALPPVEARKLPRMVSGVRLGRLAVSKHHHGRGLGKILLVAAMKKFLEIFNMAGGIGLFVDAKDDEAKAFYEHFGFVPLPSNELQLFLPVWAIHEALAEKE